MLKLTGDAFNIDNITRGRYYRVDWMGNVEKHRLTHHHWAGCCMKLYVNALLECLS